MLEYFYIFLTLYFAVMSIVLHELGHGYCALKLGDRTALERGRLSFNPIAHIDIKLTVILPIVLKLMGFPPLGAAKPVPINPMRFMHASPRRGMMLVAAAGPAVNFCIAVLALIVLHSFNFHPKGNFTGVVVTVYLLNCVLMTLNLIPFPPLDGSKILCGIIPKSMAEKVYRFEVYGLFAFFVIMMLLYSVGVLVPILNAVFEFYWYFLPEELKLH